MLSEKRKWEKHKCESSKALHRVGLVHSSEESSVMELERRDRPEAEEERQRERTSALNQKKTFVISKREVKSAWERVRKNGGTGGIDGVELAEFAENRAKNLYKIWNRMSSGSYHPQAVKRVEIPKQDGSKRPLGIPTIGDRIAQEVVRARLEPILEQVFHEDSWGYRPGKSATEAIARCRARSWENKWVLDVDIQKFFDTIDHELLLKAVRKHCGEKWMVLYIERWLKAPIQHCDGRREENRRGTPQGGVISPLLANLYLHYAFDCWMARSFPQVRFERYADDIVIHCSKQEEAELIKEKLSARLKECGLELHPEKTKVVCCDTQRQDYPNIQYKFLGYCFRPRAANNKRTGQTFTGFLPAASTEAKKSIKAKLKAELPKPSEGIGKVVERLNPILRGWFEYFGKFYASSLSDVVRWIDALIHRWLRRKYASGARQAGRLLKQIRGSSPNLFFHWRFIQTSGRAG